MNNSNNSLTITEIDCKRVLAALLEKFQANAESVKSNYANNATSMEVIILKNFSDQRIFAEQIINETLESIKKPNTSITNNINNPVNVISNSTSNNQFSFPKLTLIEFFDTCNKFIEAKNKNSVEIGNLFTKFEYFFLPINESLPEIKQTIQEIAMKEYEKNKKTNISSPKKK